MERGGIEARLEAWLAAGRRLEAELSRPEVDEPAIRELLQLRQELQEELTQLVGRESAEAGTARALAEACVEADRRAAAQARARRDECQRRLAQVRGRQAAAEGYRRAAVQAMRNGVTFFDGHV